MESTVVRSINPPTTIPPITTRDRETARTRACRHIDTLIAHPHTTPRRGRNTVAHPVRDGIVSALTYIPTRTPQAAR